MNSQDRLNSLREKLADAETELASLVDTSGDIACIIGLDGRLERLSPAWETRLGHTLGELLGQPMAKFVHSDDASATRDALASLNGDGIEVHFENRLRSSSGDFHRLDWTVIPLNSTGPAYGVATEVSDAEEGQDATEEPQSFVDLVESIATSAVETLGSGGLRRLAERSAHIYRSLVATSPNALLITTRKGRVLLCNEQGAVVHGFEHLEEMIGRNLFDYVAPEDRGRAMDNARAALESGGANDLPVTLLKSDGTRFPGELSTSAMPDTEGRPRAIIMFVKDITERKQTEEALRHAEELYRRVVETSPDAITMTDLSSKVLLFNEQAVKMYGASSPEDMIGKLAFDYIVPEERAKAQEYALKTLETGSVRNIEYTLQLRDGTRIPVELSASVIRDGGGNPEAFVAVVRDISDRKGMEEELQRVREELERRVEHQMQRKDPYGLTFRELTVLHLVAAGNSDKEIGTTLGISPLTVSKHVANILSKMDAASRSEATARAVRESLVD